MRASKDAEAGFDLTVWRATVVGSLVAIVAFFEARVDERVPALGPRLALVRAAAVRAIEDPVVATFAE